MDKKWFLLIFIILTTIISLIIPNGIVLEGSQNIFLLLVLTLLFPSIYIFSKKESSFLLVGSYLIQIAIILSTIAVPLLGHSESVIFYQLSLSLISFVIGIIGFILFLIGFFKKTKY